MRLTASASLQAIGLVIAAFVLTACGGSSSDAQPSPSAAPATLEPAETEAPPLTATTVAAPPATTAVPSPAPSPTVVAGGDLAIVDMHFHPDPGWDLAVLVALLDELGVSRAVGGSGGEAAVALAFAGEHRDRFVPFAGQDGLRELYRREGAGSLDLQSPATVAYLDGLEAELQAGCWHGIGEVFVNTLSSHRSGGLRVPADSPAMRRLWAMSATYGVPITVHMDAEPGSVAEMERLLASDREATWIWAHSGWFADPMMLRRLLTDHPNLYAELSFRDEVRSWFAVSANGQMKGDWRALLEEMPERFLLGTDVLRPSAEEYTRLVRFWRAMLEQLSPDTATMLAHGNAERLLGEVTPGDPGSCTA